MESQNEKTQRQGEAGASGESKRTEALEAEVNPQGAPSISAASSQDSPQKTVGEEVSTRATQNRNESDPAQDTIAAFLGKGESNAARYSEIIETMLSDYDGYHWAESTLLDILNFIDDNGYITEGQMQAIDNIRESNSYGNRHRKSRRSRR